MGERYDVIVVGGGGMGTATARNLAMRGRGTLLLERFTFGQRQGSSGGPTRIFRFVYHTPGYARMAMQARPAWDELQDAGRRGAAAHHGRARRRGRRAAASRGGRVGRRAGRASSGRARCMSAGPSFTFPTMPTSCSSRTAACSAHHGPSRCRRGWPPRPVRIVREETAVALDDAERRGRRSRHGAGRGVLGSRRGGHGWGHGPRPLLTTAGIDLPLRPSLEQATYFRLAWTRPSTRRRRPA